MGFFILPGSGSGPGGPGGPASWGTITGTLTNQTDLNEALGLKANSTHAHIVDNITGLQTALDNKLASFTATHEIWVSKYGNDSNSGLNPSLPKLTIGAAITAASTLITGGSAAVKIHVDAGSYTENIVVPSEVFIRAEAATLIGTVMLQFDSGLSIGTHYAPAENNQKMVNSASGGTGDAHCYYKAKVNDGRGSAGTTTGSINVTNDTTNAIVFYWADVTYVCQDGIAAREGTPSGTSHVHFTGDDVYLAGNNAEAFRIGTAAADIVANVRHILEIGTPTGTRAIFSNAGGTLKLVCNEIVADTAYNISSGSIYLVCPKITGTRTGTPTCEISDALVKSTTLEGSLESTFVKSTGATDGHVLTADGAGGVAWEAGGGGVDSFLYGFKNKIINGNFDIWQRGTSGALGGYLADRWYTATQDAVGGTISQARQATAPTDPFIDRATYFWKLSHSNFTTGASGNVFLMQPIEDVKTLTGKQVTVSFYIRDNAALANGKVNVRLAQSFGSGGSTEVGVSSSVAVLSGSWQRVSHTFTLGSMANKTIGAGHYLALQIFFVNKAGTFGDVLGDLTAGGTIDICGVQVEEGATMTDLEQRPLAVETLLCHRYYWQLYGGTGNHIFEIGHAVDVNAALFRTVFPVPMRATPTITLNSAGTEVVNGGTPVAITSFTERTKTNEVVSYQINTAGGYPGASRVTFWQSNTGPVYPIKADAEF